MIRFQKASAAALLLVSATAAAAQTNVTTYHYDPPRTGWDQSETILTPANVASGNFGLLRQVPLDEQVDAQPLFVSAQPINQNVYNVVYVATENNTIYAIDANTGNVLLAQNYGSPVPMSALPGKCHDNSNNVGITSTPVIDLATKTLYAITYTYERSKPTLRIHAIDLGTLADKVPPPVISGSAALSDGMPFGFVAASARQRSALLEVGGNIYAGFGSFCDLRGDVSRGWVLGWNSGTLNPLSANRLLNQNPSSPSNIFLTSIWMSGYGIASDGSGSLFFATSNSDFAGTSYNSTYNLEQSVVKLSTDLTTVQGYFTPNDNNITWSSLDPPDGDFGAGGVLLLPDQPGAVPHMAVAAGKVGPMYLLNRDNLGGLGPNAALGAYPSNGCWCGSSYYTGPDGIGRVVQSSGNYVTVWRVQTSPVPGLVQESVSPALNVSFQHPGFFTTVSSNGTTAGSAVIWAVERPSDPNTHYLWLKAFDPGNGAAQLFAGPVGSWPNEANANVVPVVANGRVFVASYGNLSIFGLGASGQATVQAPPPPTAAQVAQQQAAQNENELHGVAVAINDNTLILRLRDGTAVTVDTAAAVAKFLAVPLTVGHALLVRGYYGSDTFVATSILRQKDNPLSWSPDH